VSPAARRALGGLVGAAAMIAAVTVLSRVLGFVRYLAQASGLGAGAIADAYNGANVLPNVLFEVAAGGALAGAIVPLLAGPISRSDRREVQQVASAALGWTLAVLAPLGLTLALASGPIAGVLAGLSGAATADLIQFFLLVFAVQVPMYGATVLAYGVLQAHKRFFWPAFAPVLSSVVVIATYAVYGALAGGEADDPVAVGQGALRVLAWGTTAGVAAMLLPMLLPVTRLGIRIRPTLRFPPGVGARFRALALAGIGGVAAQQLSVVVVLLLAFARGGHGSYTPFLWAQQVYLLPYAVLVVPLATATFPRVAAAAARRDRIGFARLSSTTTRAVLAVATAGAAAVFAAGPAVAAVFAAVAHRPDVTDEMSAALGFLAPGVVGFAALFHVSRSLYALERARSAVLANVVGWGTVSVVALVAVPLATRSGPDPSAALAALGGASTAGMAAGALVALVALRRAAGGEALHGLGRTALVLAGSGVAAAWVGRWVVDAVGELVGRGWSVALGAAAGGAVVAVLVVVAAVAALDRGTATGLLQVEATRSHPVGTGTPPPPEAPRTP